MAPGTPGPSVAVAWIARFTLMPSPFTPSVTMCPFDQNSMLTATRTDVRPPSSLVLSRTRAEAPIVQVSGDARTVCGGGGLATGGGGKMTGGGGGGGGSFGGGDGLDGEATRCRQCEGDDVASA